MTLHIKSTMWIKELVSLSTVKRVYKDCQEATCLKIDTFLQWGHSICGLHQGNTSIVFLHRCVLRRLFLLYSQIRIQIVFNFSAFHEARFKSCSARRHETALMSTSPSLVRAQLSFAAQIFPTLMLFYCVNKCMWVTPFWYQQKLHLKSPVNACRRTRSCSLNATHGIRSEKWILVWRRGCLL